MDHKEILHFLKEETKKLEGTFVGYNEASVMLTIPVDESRYQNVKGYLEESEKGMKISFMSKVCKYSDYQNINYPYLLQKNFEFVYSKIIVYNDFIQLYASEIYDHATLEHVKEMFLEVAKEADNLEDEITGEDLH
jgi:hypothetical protein